MKVYATSTGEYSSWAIDRVFSSRAIAEAYVAAVLENSTQYDTEINPEVEEWEVEDQAPLGRKRWMIRGDWYAQESFGRTQGWQGQESGYRAFYKERSTYQIVGADVMFPLDDPTKDLYSTVDRYETFTYLMVYGWDIEAVRHLFGEKKAALTAELEGIDA